MRQTNAVQMLALDYLGALYAIEQDVKALDATQPPSALVRVRQTAC